MLLTDLGLESEVILIFASGKGVVTGAKNIDAAEEEFQSLKEGLHALM